MNSEPQADPVGATGPNFFAQVRAAAGHHERVVVLGRVNTN